MKRLLILAVSLVISSLVFAHGPGQGGFSGDNDKYWKQMDKWHNVMHGISVDAENVEDGVILKVKTDSDEVLNTLKTELKFNKEGLVQYFKGVDVDLKDIEKGIEINLISKDSQTVSRLQNWKRGLLFQYMRSQVNGQFNGGMGYGGHMGGCGGSGRGYGPGMMGGSYNNSGYGPGMMHGSYGRSDYRNDMMGDDQPMM